MRALIIGKHPVVRRGLAVLLGETFGRLAHVDAENGVDALSAVGGLRPDLIVVDPAVRSHPSGPVLVSLLRQAAPMAVLVVIASTHQPDHRRRWLAAGACHTLHRHDAEDDLRHAFRALMHGRSPRTAPATPDVDLSSTESDILQFLVRGMSNREIAARLAFAESTVKGHITALLKKHGVASRHKLAAHARTGLGDAAGGGPVLSA